MVRICRTQGLNVLRVQSHKKFKRTITGGKKSRACFSWRHHGHQQWSATYTRLCLRQLHGWASQALSSLRLQSGSQTQEHLIIPDRWNSALPCSIMSLLLLNRIPLHPRVCRDIKGAMKKKIAIKEHATLNTSTLEYAAHAWVTNKHVSLCTEQKRRSLSHVEWNCWPGELSGMIYPKLVGNEGSS